MFKLFWVFYFPNDTADGHADIAFVIADACSEIAKAEEPRVDDSTRTKG